MGCKLHVAIDKQSSKINIKIKSIGLKALTCGTPPEFFVRYKFGDKRVISLDFKIINLFT